MTIVGILANPSSGKDIRRLVAHATVVNNHEKVSIVRRLLLALFALGVDRVLIMPDQFGIGIRALDGLRDHSDILSRMSMLDMDVTGTSADTQRAASLLRQQGARCLVVLGGDGTCRAAAKGCGEVPLLPLSTGTNNVVPSFVEGTVAGLAAAYVALADTIPSSETCIRHKRLLVRIDDGIVDEALVEVAAVAARFTGARAIWDPAQLRQLFVTRASPASIGLSAILGMANPIALDEPFGALALLDPAASPVQVPVAPGRIAPVGVRHVETLLPGRWHTVVPDRPLPLALDGERELPLTPRTEASVCLDLDGPWIVDVRRTLLLAQAAGVFAA